MLAGLALVLAADASRGAAVTTISATTASGAGQSGNGAKTNCMVTSDAGYWSGGAAGVQGSGSTVIGGAKALAAITAFKFSIAPQLNTLNATYGAGEWSIQSARLSLQCTLYANNSRFGAGAGTFDVRWIARDDWESAANKAPLFALSEQTLSTWSASALLAQETNTWSTPKYTGTLADLTSGKWVTDKTGDRQAVLSYDLALSSAFTADVIAGGDVSLYLMPTSDTMGITIFTGGAAILPTLTLEIVPEPSTLLLLTSMRLLGRRRSRR